MQNFKKIDREKKQVFFIWKFAALFLTYTVESVSLELSLDADALPAALYLFPWCIQLYFMTHEWLMKLFMINYENQGSNNQFTALIMLVYWLNSNQPIEQNVTLWMAV